MIKLSKSILDQSEINALSKVILESGYLGIGEEVKKFEQALQQFLSTDRTVICVNTGTSALHLAIEATCPPNSEILVPSLTYIASYQAISAARCIPVSCEVDIHTGLIDLADAERRITSQTCAIMPVHYAGQPVDMQRLISLADKYHLRIIEDAAHAFGSSFEEKLIGSFGDITCFSFDGIKNITSGEGGAIVTNDKTVAQRVKDARLLGVEKDTDNRYIGRRSWEFDVKIQGYRYHMGNLYAAIGIEQLKKAPHFFAKRHALAKNYHHQLSSIEGISLFPLSTPNIVPHIYPIRLPEEKRDPIKNYLEEQKIETGIHYFPNHFLSYYKHKNETLPQTEQLYKELLTLPLHPGLNDEDQNYIIAKLKEGLKTNHKLKEYA